MKIEIDAIEFKSNDTEQAILLTNVKNDTILILSKNLLSSETYLEWNEQSKSVYNAITSIQIDGNQLYIYLNELGKQVIGFQKYNILLLCQENEYLHFVNSMTLIFGETFEKTEKPFIHKKTDIIEYSNIKYLNLEGKNLTYPPKNLEKYVALEKLFIKDNPNLDLITTFPMLTSLPHLKQLQLSIYGNIPEQLCELTSLESLHIEGDADFDTLPIDIGSLNNLNYLYLQSKSPIVLPSHFSDLKALEYMHIRAEKWNLPAHFYKLSGIKHLDLYNCDISAFPSEMSQMTNLETIIIGTNHNRDDSELFATLGQIKSLRTIEINISGLPENISDCNQIEHLEIYGEEHSAQEFYIPFSFSNLTQLKTLTLHHCHFKKLPDCLFDLVSLQQLHLSNCTFTEIPYLISKLELLEEISIIDCPDFSVIHSDLSKLNSLSKIYFDNVPSLASLPKELHKLRDIKELYLSEYEKIENVPDHWIKKMNENGG